MGLYSPILFFYVDTMELWEHQKKAVDRAKQHKDFALFFEMGTGKTLATIRILEGLYQGTVKPTLIICPIVVVENWVREFDKFSQIPRFKVIPLLGSQKHRVKLFNDHGRDSIFISNYESLLMKDLYKCYGELNATVMVFDESHKLKSPSSKRTKAAIRLAAPVNHKYLLTGTPVLNSAMDLFSQYQVMDGGKTFGDNFYIFRARYFYDANANMPSHVHFPNWKLKANSYERISKAINDTSMQVKKSECLDLPPLVRENVYVEMTLDQTRMYHQMKDDFLTFYNDKACVAQLALTKALRLQQIVSGFIKTDDKVERSLGPTPREKALKELLYDLCPKNKVIVWAVFKYNFKQIRNICEGLRISYVEGHGAISQKEKQRAIDRFNNDEGCRVFIGHPGALGIGVNLTVSNYSIYYSRDFSLEHDLQSEARNYRGGSEIHEKITRIDLVCPNTIDEIVQKRLAGKLEMGNKLLEALDDEFW